MKKKIYTIRCERYIQECAVLEVEASSASEALLLSKGEEDDLDWLEDEDADPICSARIYSITNEEGLAVDLSSVGAMVWTDTTMEWVRRDLINYIDHVDHQSGACNPELKSYAVLVRDDSSRAGPVRVLALNEADARAKASQLRSSDVALSSYPALRAVVTRPLVVLNVTEVGVHDQSLI